MDYFCLIQSMISYIEARVGRGIDGAALEHQMGLSQAHLREVFKSRTGQPLGGYIQSRRIAHAAFELAHGDRRIIDIAADYEFESCDTFTRAFRRHAGLTPSEFRRSNARIGRVKLVGGVFGPGIRSGGGKRSLPIITEDNMSDMRKEKTDSSCILYGVQRVRYCYEECTPYPACLRSCLNYLGQEIGYRELMAASGAAFRLRWNKAYWDGGNVDIMYIYERPEEAFVRAFRAAGRSFTLHKRGPETAKADFIAVIKSEIDAGRPVIALGIIGPPEAGIVAGYRDDGQTLLGWNFFQDNPEFAAGVAVHESGYFITDKWWENPNTVMLMTIGEDQGEGENYREILTNGLDVMTREKIDQSRYAADGGRKNEIVGGRAAYDAWAAAMADASQFPSKAPLPLLFERLMCQIDAITMVGEGRAYAAGFLDATAAKLRTRSASLSDAAGPGKPVGDLAITLAAKAEAAGALLDREFKTVQSMAQPLGGFAMGETQARNLAKPEVRGKIVELIRQARDLDSQAAAAIRELLAAWPEDLSIGLTR